MNDNIRARDFDLGKLKSILADKFPVGRFIHEEDKLREYSFDMTEGEPSMPDFVVKPLDTNEVVWLVELANEHKIPLIPAAARTNLGGLTIPVERGIIVDMTDMRKIHVVNETEMYAIIEPGVTFGDIKEYLDERHPSLRFGYPLSPPYTSIVANCLLDGLANLSLKHGTMAEWINGVEAVLPTGEVIRTGAGSLSDVWFSKAPMPDLTGLFVNWQGSTGIVTRMAVQLWPAMKYRKRMFAMLYKAEHVFVLMRQLSRTGIFDDIGGLSWPTGKMLFGLKYKMTRDPDEPEYYLYLDISGNSKAEMKAKQAVIKETMKRARKDGMELEDPIDIVDLVKVEPNFGKFAEFPTTLDFLLDHGGGGLTWVGTYGPTAKWEEGYRKGAEIMEEAGFPPIAVTRPMRGGHFAVLRFIMIFDKNDEEEVERVREVNIKLCDMVMELGYIPYKSPAWVVEKFMAKMDKNSYELMKKLKNLLDPNRIMNPGRWLF